MSGCFDDAELDFSCPGCRKSLKIKLGELKKPGVKCPQCGLAFETSQLKRDMDEAERSLKDFGKM